MSAHFKHIIDQTSQVKS